MNTDRHAFASDLARYLLQHDCGLNAGVDNSYQLLAQKDDGQQVVLDLTPVQSGTQPVSAANWFADVETTPGLLNAYERCRSGVIFEDFLPEAKQHVNDFAEQFRTRIISRASDELTNAEARIIGKWVSQLDEYTAIKAIESLLNSPADRALLAIAPKQKWAVTMDHIAIRCGSQANGDAKRIVDHLCEHSGYVPPQADGQDYYQFEDGWDAYPVYKMLDNGVMLRLFVDESAAGYDTQIIQHWNHVYGYTAHHLALRVSRFTPAGLIAVPLCEVIGALATQGVNTMAPTGQYTAGLLEQVFTEPSRTPDVPSAIKRRLAKYGGGLEQVIENGKLIELVSRREMPAEFASRYFELYGIRYEVGNSCHSAPCYTYFLPAQAAHVIRTSVNVA